MRASHLSQTIKYASFFNATLTKKDLHLWLISEKTSSLNNLSKLLSKHPQLQRKLVLEDNPVRLNKLDQVTAKLQSIQKLIFVLRFIPTIRLVALTGSLSINNPKKNDDIDLMIITSPNTLWLTRPIVIALVSLLLNRRKPSSNKARNQICTNLWLDTISLTLPKNKQNLYTAHEVLQARPLFNRGETYQQFLKANTWTKKYLANAYKRMSRRAKDISRPLSGRVPSDSSTTWMAAFLHGFFQGGVRQLNLFALQLQHIYMKKKITKEHLTPHVAYFHPNSLYPKIKKYLF